MKLNKSLQDEAHGPHLLNVWTASYCHWSTNRCYFARFEECHSLNHSPLCVLDTWLNKGNDTRVKVFLRTFFFLLVSPLWCSERIFIVPDESKNLAGVCLNASLCCSTTYIWQRNNRLLWSLYCTCLDVWVVFECTVKASKRNMNGAR